MYIATDLTICGGLAVANLADMQNPKPLLTLTYA